MRLQSGLYPRGVDLEIAREPGDLVRGQDAVVEPDLIQFASDALKAAATSVPPAADDEIRTGTE